MATKAERKPAPNIVADDPWFDDRAALIKKLNAENPEYVHMYQAHDVKDYELQRKHQEILRDESGDIVHLDGDPVVRILKEQHQVNRAASCKRSEQVAKTVVDRQKPSLVASPKKPITEE